MLRRWQLWAEVSSCKGREAGLHLAGSQAGGVQSSLPVVMGVECQVAPPLGHGLQAALAPSAHGPNHSAHSLKPRRNYPGEPKLVLAEREAKQ